MTVHEKNMFQIKTMRENLKQIREEKGWSVEEVSKKTNIDVEILRLIESESDFDIDYLFTLCSLYGIKVDKIFLPI